MKNFIFQTSLILSATFLMIGNVLANSEPVCSSMPLLDGAKFGIRMRLDKDIPVPAGNKAVGNFEFVGDHYPYNVTESLVVEMSVKDDSGNKYKFQIENPNGSWWTGLTLDLALGKQLGIGTSINQDPRCKNPLAM